MRNIDVSPIEIRDYALSYGWTLVKEALKEGLFVLNSPHKDYKQLLFPQAPDSPDFDTLAKLSIHKIADQTKKTADSVIEEIREVNDDVISLRYFSEHKNVNSLSLQETIGSIEAIKQMILAAGSSVINPVLYHKRLTSLEALELLKKTRFRHTEQGSLALKISCPVQLEMVPQIILPGNMSVSRPMSRKAFEIINFSALKLLNTVKEDGLAELLEEQKQAEKPIISYNFCESIVNLFDDETELPFELRFQWSRKYLNELPGPQVPSVIRFPYSFKPKLNELKNYFKPAPKEHAAKSA